MNGNNPYLPVAATVTAIENETEDKLIKTFRLRCHGARFAFSCGQFAEVLIPGRGEAPFGMASSPMLEEVEFTVSKVGTVTSAMHDLEIGQTIGLRGPPVSYTHLTLPTIYSV